MVPDEGERDGDIMTALLLYLAWWTWSLPQLPASELSTSESGVGVWVLRLIDNY